MIGTHLSTHVLIWFLSDHSLMQNIHCLLFWLNFINSIDLNTFRTYELIWFKSSHFYCKAITTTGIPPILVFAHLVAFIFFIFEVASLSHVLSHIVN